MSIPQYESYLDQLKKQITEKTGSYRLTKKQREDLENFIIDTSMLSWRNGHAINWLRDWLREKNDASNKDNN